MTMTKIISATKLAEDSFSKEFTSKNEFTAAIKEFLEETTVSEVNTSEISAVAVSGGGLLVNDLREDSKVDDSVSDDALIETASEVGSNMAIVCDDEGHLLSPNALSSFIARMGVGCPAFSKLPLNVKIDWLNTAIKYMPHKKLYLVLRGEKVRGILTERYNTISQNEIFSATLKMLERDFEDVSFKKGVLTHEYTSADYIIENDEVLENYKSWLNSFGFTYLDDAKICVSVTTSDTTDSAVHLNTMIIGSNIRMNLGSPITMAHLKSASIDSWKKKITGIGGHVENLCESVKKLGKINISYPDTVFTSVGLEMGIGKKILAQYMEEFHLIYSYTTNPTAHDIFYALFRALSENEMNFSKERFITISENLSRCLHPGFDWASYDTPVAIK